MQGIDSEKLISEVQKRPALWDMKIPEYSDRVLRKQSWDEICDVFAKEGMSLKEKNELGIVLHKKWKNIRDHFSRDFQSRKRKSGSEGGASKAPYIFSQQLQFLRDTIEMKGTCNSIEGTPAAQPDSDVEGGVPSTSESSSITMQTTPVSQRIGKKRQKDAVEEKIIESLNRLHENKSKKVEEDDNRQFLLSLLPTITSLPKRLNSKCRLEIMQIVCKYEEYALLQSNDTPRYPVSVPVVEPRRNYTGYEPPTQITSPEESSIQSFISGFSEESQYI